MDGRPKLRILVLHGFRQSSRRVRAQTNNMRKALRDVAEFDYLNAPHAYAPADTDRYDGPQVAGPYLGTAGDPDAHQYCWWNSSADDPPVYEGWDQSLANIVHNLRAQPVDGIMGFSQGAAFTAVLSALQATMGEELPFKFAICVSGFPSRAAAHAELIRPVSINVPSFHTYGTQDTLVPNERSLALAHCFVDPVVVEHQGGHFTPQYLPLEALEAFVAPFQPSAPAPRVRPPAVGPLRGLQAKMDATVVNEWDGVFQPAGLSCDLARFAPDMDVAAHVAELAASGGDLEELAEDLVVVAWAARLSAPILKRNSSHKKPEGIIREQFQRVWIELFAVCPDKVLRMTHFLPSYQAQGEHGQGWRDLADIATTMAVRFTGVPDTATPDVPALPAHPELGPKAEAVIDRVVEMFAEQLRADQARMEAMAGNATDTQASGWPSDCAIGAPRLDSRADRVCRLPKRVARLLNPLHAPSEAPQEGVDPMHHTKGICYMAFQHLLRGLVHLLVQTQPAEIARQRDRVRHEIRLNRIRSKVPAMWVDAPISEAVLFPEPVPVTVAPLEELQPLFRHLEANAGVQKEQAFMRGTLVDDGRLDLCKQVVGPTGIGPLMAALQQSDKVQALLLGNNIVGDGGAPDIAAAMRNPLSSLDIWYIAGNHFTADGMAAICPALHGNTKVRALWLKRNPLRPAGAVPVAELLRHNSYLQTLDLVNTGLLDEGVVTIMEALRDNASLRHIYLGTNGVTEVGAQAIGAHLATGNSRLDTLYLAVNRIGDAGAAHIAEGLRADSALRRLGLASNRIGTSGMEALSAAVTAHPGLQLLDVGFYRSTPDVGEVGNCFGDAGCPSVAAMIRGSATLRSLSVRNNGITPEGMAQLLAALADNPRMATFEMSQFGEQLGEFQRESHALLEAHRGAMTAEELQEMEDIDLPQHILEIRSVYRGAPLPEF